MGLGIGLCINLSQKKRICTQLVVLCDLILSDLNFRMTSAPELIVKLLKDNRLTALKFIDENSVKSRKKIKSSLDRCENEEISHFLFEFGKSDILTQKNLVSNFRDFMKNSEVKYSEFYKKNSKLYVALSLSVALMLTIVIA